MKRPALALLILTCCATGVRAQQLLDCAKEIAQTVADINAAKANGNFSNAQKAQQISNSLSRFELVATCANQVSVAKVVQAKRSDVQTGASSGTSGTTTAVASASKPDFLGLALENGTTTQTTSGTSSTVSINPWKFVDSIAHDGQFTVDPASAGSNLIRKLSLSLTLNTGDATNSKQTTTSSGSGTAQTPITLITQLKQVSNFTAHFDIINDRDPMSRGAAKKIQTIKVPDGFFDTVRPLAAFIRVDANAETQVLLTFTGDLNAEVAKFVTSEHDKIGKDRTLAASAVGAQQGIEAVIKQNNALYNSLLHSPTLSFEYSLDRQPMAQADMTGAGSSATTTAPLVNPPNLHTARLIHSWGYYTLNASASFFDKKTSTMPDVWRDLQFGAKVDIPFPGISKVVDKGTLEFSGLFVNLHQMPLGVPLMINGVTVNQPGKIGLFQAKYNIPVSSGTGVQVPVSVTYSNRTDLIKETSIQANIGITWDMSKLLAAKQTPSQ
jgi:hypothetical protein